MTLDEALDTMIKDQAFARAYLSRIRADAMLGEHVRIACANDPERLRVWASAVELMWGGDLSRFLVAVAKAVEPERQEGEQK